MPLSISEERRAVNCAGPSLPLFFRREYAGNLGIVGAPARVVETDRSEEYPFDGVIPMVHSDGCFGP